VAAGATGFYNFRDRCGPYPDRLNRESKTQLPSGSLKMTLFLILLGVVFFWGVIYLAYWCGKEGRRFPFDPRRGWGYRTREEREQEEKEDKEK
jgi:hypothetical protein